MLSASQQTANKDKNITIRHTNWCSSVSQCTGPFHLTANVACKCNTEEHI